MWRIVFRKEFREIFSDSRTRINTIVGPLLITPLLLALVGSMARRQATDARDEQITVGIVGLSAAPSIAAELRGTEVEHVLLKPVETEAEAERGVRERRMRAAILIGDEAERRLKSDEPVPLTVLQDAGNESSLQAAGRVKELLRQRGDVLVTRRLQENGLSRQLAIPFQIGDRKMPGSGSGMILLALFLPYILAISAIMGGVLAASDAVAGEKERGTLETLLVMPVSRRDMAIGKFCTVTATALVSSVLSVVGLFWPFYVKLPMFAWMSAEGLTLGAPAIAAILLVQIPLAVLGAGVLLALSTWARNQKEMQTFLAPVIMTGTLGAMLSMLLKANAPLFWAAAPITNVALVLKQALQGTLSPVFVGISCATSAVYAFIAVAVAAWLFRREDVLARS